MSEFSWIEHMFRAEGFAITPKLHWFLTADPAVITPFDLEQEEFAIRHLETLQKQFPNLMCVPFARRRDRDDLFAIVLQDSVYKRGQVILIDIEEIYDYIVEEFYDSLDAWAQDVWTQLEKWREASSNPLR